MDSSHCSEAGSNGKAERRLFVRVDRAVLPILANIAPHAAAVYLSLKSYADADGVCYPKQSDIAKRAGVSVPTVDRTIPALARAGLITVSKRSTGGGRLSNLYQFMDTQNIQQTFWVDSKTSDRCEQNICGMDAKHLTDGASITTEVEPPKKNHRESAPAKPAAPPELLAIVDRLNSLPSGLIPRIKVPLSPKIVSRFRTAWKDPELRDALSDPERLADAITRAKFAHRKPWATFLGLLATNKAGEYKITKLLQGGYDDNGQHEPATAESSDQIIERVLARKKQRISE